MWLPVSLSVYVYAAYDMLCIRAGDMYVHVLRVLCTFVHMKHIHTTYSIRTVLTYRVI